MFYTKKNTNMFSCQLFSIPLCDARKVLTQAWPLTKKLCDEQMIMDSVAPSVRTSFTVTGADGKPVSQVHTQPQ